MAFNVTVSKGGIQLGTGSSNSTTSITSYTATAGRVTGLGRNVQVTATSGNNIGATINTRVIADGGTSLTLQDPVPFS